MHGIYLKFDEIPQIGFAHHFHTENYSQKYNIKDDSFELVYVKTGGIIATLYGKNYDIQPQSILVLFRCLPIRLRAKDNSPQTHCTVQIKVKGQIEFVDDNFPLPSEDSNGIILPFIIPPCSENEAIKKELYSIISNIGSLGDKGKFTSSLCAMGILSKLDNMYRQKLYAKRSKASLLEYKIKHYISENISNNFTISDIAQEIGKTPNYLNSIFKEINGMGIRQYINGEKIRIICEILKVREVSFKKACENVAIYDISYGYRLFKKHTGVTPSDFMNGTHLHK